jgi:hypothetical protein
MLLYRQVRSTWESTFPVADNVEGTTPSPPALPVPSSFPDGFLTAMMEIKTLTATTTPTPATVPYSAPLILPTPPSQSTSSFLSPSDIEAATAEATKKVTTILDPSHCIIMPYVVDSPANLSRLSQDGGRLVQRLFYPRLPRAATAIGAAGESLSSGKTMAVTVEEDAEKKKKKIKDGLKPPERPLLRFNGPPVWVVPMAEAMVARETVTVAEMEKRLKVDTSLPGKRKRKLQEAAAAAAAADAVNESTLERVEEGDVLLMKKKAKKNQTVVGADDEKGMDVAKKMSKTKKREDKEEAENGEEKKKGMKKKEEKGEKKGKT